MCRTRLFFTISIFLFAASFADASGSNPPEDSAGTEYWLSEAVRYERTVFDGGSPSAINSALMAKADCYCNAGEWALAAQTLDRVRMFALSDAQRDSVTFCKGVCYYASGNYDDALACLCELSRDSGDPVSAARGKSQLAGMLLSLLPPLGHIYADRPGEGILSMAMNAGVIAPAACFICGGYYVTGLLGGAIALERTYMGAQERVAVLIEEYNEKVKANDKISIFAQ